MRDNLQPPVCPGNSQARLGCSAPSLYNPGAALSTPPQEDNTTPCRSDSVAPPDLTVETNQPGRSADRQLPGSGGDPISGGLERQYLSLAVDSHRQGRGRTTRGHSPRFHQADGERFRAGGRVGLFLVAVLATSGTGRLRGRQVQQAQRDDRLQGGRDRDNDNGDPGDPQRKPLHHAVGVIFNGSSKRDLQPLEV